MKRFKLTGKILAFLLVAAMTLFAFTACGGSDSAKDDTKEEKAEPKQVVVFAAASMTETLEQLKADYEKEHPEIELIYTFDSSGTLKTQIEEGAGCDIFISAAQKQMDALDATVTGEGNPDGLDFIDHDTRFDILENKVVLVVPEGNPKNIKSFDDMKAGLEDGSIKMAMGNEDVPVGQYTQKVLAYYGLDEKALADKGVITYGSNVKEVTTQVAEGTVDCGVIYETDAYSAGFDKVATATEEMCGKTIYPIAILKQTAVKDEAADFIEYLKSDHASEVFEKVGFIPLT